MTADAGILPGSLLKVRVFLAPLFFIQGFCRNCVRVIYSQHPESWVWQHELGPLPPLGHYRAGAGFGPDYPLLSMFDEFLISEEAYELMTARPPRWLSEWAIVLTTLREEGSLAVFDLDEEMRRSSHLRGQLLRKDMKDPARWSHAMTYHDSLMTSAQKAFGMSPLKARSPSWRFNARHLPGVLGSDGQSHLLSALPLVDPGDDPGDPHFQLHQTALDALRRQLREVNAALSVSTALGAPAMLWSPYREFFAEKARDHRGITTAPTDAESARRFFTVAFPRYAPDTAKRLAYIRADRRITALRKTIRQAASSGDLMDPDYPQRILEEVLRLETRLGKIRKISGWFAAVAGLVPPLGVGTTILSEAVTGAVEHFARRPYQWFYLISDGRGPT